MPKQVIFCITILFGLWCGAQNKIYYISATGNNSNNGLSVETAWQTLSPVNNLDLKPGDQILLEGGQSFTGYLEFNANDNGTTENPIIISSYGTGKAIIHAIDNVGLSATNTGGLNISNLIFEGNSSNYNGMYFLINQTTADIDHIYIDNVEVFDFGGRGFLLGADNTDKGFNHVSILNSSFHDNGIAGLETFGSWPLISHTDFTIGHCRFYNNLGTFTTSAMTGYGIAVSGVDGGVIEYCEAYDNGANNRNPGGGPVGIWVYDTKNIVMQYCESHHNKAGLLKDGGGFDIDGGSAYCTIQYCYSHDNEGPGFALVEYGSSNEFTGNIVRYNVSENDARKNSYGSILLYAVDALHPVKSSYVYNNTVYVNASNLTNGTPSAIAIQSQNFTDVHVGNNIFYAINGVDLMNSWLSVPTNGIFFQNNDYYSAASVYNFWWNGSLYTSLNSWQAATGQELNGNISMAFTQNPLLQDPGTGGTVSPADGGQFTSLFGYQLNALSPLVDKGISFGDMGLHDFFGTALSLGSGYDIGAAEATSFTLLPLRIISFKGIAKANSIELEWKVTGEENIKQYEVQKSVDGYSYIAIGSVPASNIGTYHFHDTYERSEDVYYRLRCVYPDDKSEMSNSIRISKTGLKEIHAFYKEGQGVQVKLYSDKKEDVLISIYSANGQLLYTSLQNLQKGFNSITIDDALKWKQGQYFIHIKTENTAVVRFVK